MLTNNEIEVLKAARESVAIRMEQWRAAAADPDDPRCEDIDAFDPHAILSEIGDSSVLERADMAAIIESNLAQLDALIARVEAEAAGEEWGVWCSSAFMGREAWLKEGGREWFGSREQAEAKAKATREAMRNSATYKARPRCEGY